MSRTAYEMVCGAPRYHGETPQSLFTAKLTRTPPKLSLRRAELSPQLESIIMRCLAVDAERRPANAAEILDASSDPAVLSTGAVVLSGGALRRTLARPMSRQRLAALAAMACVGVAAIATATAAASVRLATLQEGGDVREAAPSIAWTIVAAVLVDSAPAH